MGVSSLVSNKYFLNFYPKVIVYRIYFEQEVMKFVSHLKMQISWNDWLSNRNVVS